MGLDSVELVMEMEKYFNIRIPDREAEKIHTVQDMITCVAGHLQVTADTGVLKNKMMSRIINALQRLQLLNGNITPETCIAAFLPPDDKEIWTAFKREMNLQLPPVTTHHTKPETFISKLVNRVAWRPLYNWQQITFGHFATAVCALNRDVFVDRQNIQCLYEIHVAVMNITANRTGADYFEITPEKSFTSDLGVD